MKDFFGTNHPFFRPLWRRVVVTLLVGGWTVVEFVNGAQFWGMLFAALTGAAIWGFFIDFNPDRQSDTRKEE